MSYACDCQSNKYNGGFSIHIVFVTSNYPTKSKPYRGAFVQELVHAIANKGVKCSVVSPLLAYSNRNEPVITTEGKDSNPIKIIKPRQYITASNKKISFFNTYDVTQISFEKAARKGVKALDKPPSLFYGHFLYPSAKSASKLAKEHNVPCVAAVGESSPYSHLEKKGMVNNPYNDFKSIEGIVSVSKDNALFCANELGISKNRIETLPNSVDLDLFYPRNKEKMRKKYNLPRDKFLVAFTGHFIERKGPNRVLSAILGLKDVGAVFMGAGPIELEAKEILFKGAVKHDMVPELLSASDVFVLPTLAEGSCNAIIEAMACGLPVISSIGTFNDEILNEKVSIRVDPLNINEIRESILKLYEKVELKNTLSVAAVRHARAFDINIRAEKIISFMEKVLSEGGNAK